MQPNPPINRMRHVIKTYKDSKNPWVPLQVIRSAYYLMGLDDEVVHFNSFIEPFEDFLRRDYSPGFVAVEDARVSQSGDLPDLKEWVDEYADRPGNVDALSREQLVDYGWKIVDSELASTLPSRHEADFVIPWMARELGRLAKAARRGHATWTDYTDAEVALITKGPAIAMWSTRENIDLSKTDLATALEAIKHFDAFEGEMPQGRVVYEFDDGYTLQELSDNELEAEGEAMQHCVGSYCLADSPSTHIYSLRDERGMPHVTMEYNGETGHFVQIQGKQNERPAPKYRPYIREAIIHRFDEDPIGLLMIGEPAKNLDLTNKMFDGVDFGALEADLERADFQNAEFRSCEFDHLYMPDCDFTDASLNSCSFNNATLDYSAFDRADLVGCDFISASCRDVTFAKAELHGVTFQGADLEDAVFTHALITSRHTVFGTSTDLKGSHFRGASVRLGNFADPETAMEEIAEWPDVLVDHEQYLAEGGVVRSGEGG